MLTATYSPEDNKFRLYPSQRLDSETYARVKAAGFKWAPKQELFVAPMWTPGREDLLIELCGEIGDEDTSLVERAEQRAERFGDYSDKREAEAHRAHAAVAAIADNIPLGQPILVGHSSERRARKDAERIRSGMSKAVNLWRTSEYWERRAADALSHAKYKEMPGVRARRIKTLEADLRKCQREQAEAEKWLKCWSLEGLTVEQGIKIANHCWLRLPRKEGDKPDFDGQPSAYDALTNYHPTLYAPRTLAEVVEHAKAIYPRSIAHSQRWVEHYQNRIAYERAMLAEAGGLKADKFAFEVGGEVLVGHNWVIIKRINRKAGRVLSLSTNGRYGGVVPAEEVSDYRAPSVEQTAKVKAAIKAPPLCNYPGEGFAHITAEQWDKLPKEYRSCGASERSSGRIAATDTTGAHRVRCAMGCFLPRELAAGKGDMWRHTYHHVYITDQKRVDPPARGDAPKAVLPAPDVDWEVLQRETAARAASAAKRQAKEAAGQAFEGMRETLKAGVQVVSAPQLFPTPDDVAARMVELARLEPGECVLEPSAGTGSIVRAVLKAVDTEVLAYEINQGLASQLGKSFPSYKLQVRCQDFLEVTDFQDCYPAVLMNPPFANGADIKHIKHALTFVAPGGRLVAICANGPRQHEVLRPLASHWEELPAGTFEGTGVRAALLVIEKAADAQAVAA